MNDGYHIVDGQRKRITYAPALTDPGCTKRDNLTPKMVY